MQAAVNAVILGNYGATGWPDGEASIGVVAGLRWPGRWVCRSAATSEVTCPTPRVCKATATLTRPGFRGTGPTPPPGCAGPTRRAGARAERNLQPTTGPSSGGTARDHVAAWWSPLARQSSGSPTASVAARPATVPQISYDVHTVGDRLQIRARVCSAHYLGCGAVRTSRRHLQPQAAVCVYLVASPAPAGTWRRPSASPRASIPRPRARCSQSSAVLTGTKLPAVSSSTSRP